MLVEFAAGTLAQVNVLCKAVITLGIVGRSIFISNIILSTQTNSYINNWTLLLILSTVECVSLLLAN